MLGQRRRRWTDIRSTMVQRIVVLCYTTMCRVDEADSRTTVSGHGACCELSIDSIGRSINIVLMLDQRRRRWANIRTALVQRLTAGSF